VNDLASEIFQLLRPARVTALRPSVPQVRAAGAANAAVLNRLSMVFAPPLTFAMRSGRTFPAPAPTLSPGEVTVTCGPAWKDVIPESCQPPRALRTKALAFFLQNDRSQM
jgi:hypothetical protein